MIAFRHVDARFPFLWEDTSQPPGRWHGPGEGPAHYLADTPDGAWAEFLRHEEITEVADLPEVRRSLWAIDIGDAPASSPRLSRQTLLGGLGTYEPCQAEARRLRRRGETAISALSAALLPGSAGGWRVQGGLRRGPPRDGRVIVLFGPRPDLVGWAAASEGRPGADLVFRVRRLTP